MHASLTHRSSLRARRSSRSRGDLRRRLAWPAALLVGVITSLVVLPAPAQAALVTPFRSVFSAQTNGSVAITGNALLTCRQQGSAQGASCPNSLAGSGSGSTSNNALNMVDLDVDDVDATRNSSRAGVRVPADGEVLFAGLYWSAVPTNPTSPDTTLDFRTPTTGYQTLIPDRVDQLPDGNRDFSAFADVTALVRAGGSGEYWGADIAAATGGDRYASWSLVLVYADPTAPLRDLNVFNGYGSVRGIETVETTIAGFLTPPRGPVNAEVGMVVYEGDQTISGDYLELNGQRLSDAQSPSGNFFQSRITEDGRNVTDRTPASLNNLGTDAKTVDARGAIANSATSARFRFGSDGDFYYPAVLTTQIDLFAPTIEGTKSVANLAGTTPARAGDTLEYTVSLANSGDDDATRSVVRDRLPDGLTFVPGSLRISAGAGAGPVSDAADGDRGEYDAASRTVVVRVGTGANGPVGGVLSKNDSTTVRFRATVDRDAAGTTIRNDADLDYRALTLGEPFTFTTPPVATPVGTLADLALTKSASPAVIAAGDVVTYTLAVSNAGPNPATTVRVRDTLPQGTTLVAATPSQGTCTTSGREVNCTLGQVPAPGTASVVLRVRVGADFAGTGVANVASVAAATSDDDPTNDDASVTTATTTTADLRAAKTITPASPAPGEEATFTLRAVNDGPSLARDVVVADDLPAGLAVLAVTSPTSTCAVDGRSVRCTAASLAVGEAVEVSVRTRLDPSWTGGTLSNTVDVSASTADPDPTDNRATATLSPAVQRGDLRITKRTLTSPVVAGEEVRYLVTVTNAGPSDARAVSVADPSPAGLGALGAVASQGSCTTPGGDVDCTLGTLPAGGAATVVVTATVDPTRTGTITNTATAASPDDALVSDNTASSTDAVTASADLSLVKSFTPDPVVDGDPVTYELTVSNAGPSVARAPRLLDDVPAPLVVGTASTDAGSCTLTGRTVDCDLDALAPGASTVVTVTAGTPPGGGADGVVNTASVSSPTPDPVPGDTTASARLSTAAQANITMSKQVAPSPLVAGGPVTFTLTARNAGPSDASGVTILDDVPAAVVVDAASLPAACTLLGRRVSCERPVLLAGASWEVVVTGTVRAGTDPGSLSNTARADAATPTDPTQSDNAATATATLTTRADLSLRKTAPATATAGGVLDYDLVVRNDGPSQARQVAVLDQLPPGTTLRTAGTSAACTLWPDTVRTVSCDLATLEPGEERTLTVSVGVSSDVPDGAVLDNRAEVSSATEDPDPANDTAAASTTVRTTADLAVVKTADRTRLAAGTENLYTLTVTNDGPSDAVGVELVDTLPAGVALLEATSASGACTSAGQVVTCTRGSLAAGATWTVQVRVLVDPAARTDQTNTASVSSGTDDPDPGDDQAVLTNGVDAAGDLDLVKTADTAPFVPGRQVRWTLTTSNFGPATMTDPVLSDLVPAGLTEVRATTTDGTCTVAPADGAGRVAVRCDLDDLAPERAARVLLTAVLAEGYAAPSLTNEATITSTTRDLDADNDTATVISDVAPSADVALTKRSDVSPLTSGVPATYLVRAVNRGPSTARDVVIVDDVPADLAVLAARVSGVPGATCAVAGQQVECAVGDLPTTAEALIEVDVRVRASFVGSSLTNTTNATSTTPDPVPANDDARATTPVRTLAEVAVRKTRSLPATGPVVPGGTVAWDVVVTGDGPSTARGVVVTDTAPADVTGLRAVVLPGPGAPAGEPCSIEGRLVTCALGDLEPDAVLTVRVSGTLAADHLGPVENTASVTTTTTDPTPGDDTSTSTDATAATADVSLTKTRTSGPVVPGRTVTWELVAANAGPSVARAVSLLDEVPDALTGVTATPRGGGPALACTTTPAPGGPTRVACDLGDLAPGQQVTVVVSGALPAGWTGTLTNTATVLSPTDSTPGNGTATSTGTAAPSADLGIDKIRTSGPVVPGTDVTWDLTVTSAGPSVARAVRVDDDVADVLRRLTATSTAGTCTIAPGNVVACDLGDLAPGASVTVTVSGRLPADALGALSNTATVRSATPDPDPTDDTSTADGDALPRAAVSVTKTRPSGPVVPGRPVTWRVTVTNKGPSSARAVVVRDDADDALTGLVATGPGATCAVAGGNEVTCRVGSLAPDTSAVITLTAQVPAGFEGDLPNTATVTTPDDTTVGDDSATVAGTAVPQADVATTKTLTSGTPVPGSRVTWRVVVRNAGPSVARDVTLTDDVTDELTALTVSVAGPAGACTTGAGNAVSCDLGDLAPGQERVVAITGLLPADLVGDLVNTAVASSPTDTTPGNDVATSRRTTVPDADLSLTKARASGPVVPGRAVRWNLTVANTGPSVAREAVLVDDVPDALTGLTAVTATPGATCTVDAGNVVRCELGDLDPGTEVVVVVNGDLPPDFTGSLDNTASVTSPTDTTPSNDTASSPGTAAPEADVAVTKTRPSGPVVPGQDVTWEVRVLNAGPSLARRVSLADDVADAVTDLTVLVGPDAPAGATCSVGAGNVVTCDLGDLAVDDVATVRLSGGVPPAFSGVLDNVATVTSPTDTTPGNNTARIPGDAEPDAAVSLLKQRTSGPVVPGTPVTWRLLATNGGPSTARDVRVEDDVADSLVSLTAQVVTGPPGATCTVTGTGPDPETRTNLVACELGDLDPGTTVVVEVAGDLPADYRGRVDNTATVSSPTDDDPTDDTSSVGGAAQPEADVSVSKARTSGPVVAGTDVTWRVVVENAGPSVARDVTVADDAPDVLTGVTATLEGAPAGAACTVGAGNRVDCTLGQLDPGERTVLVVSGSLPAGATGRLDNLATASSPTDTSPANNTGTSTGQAVAVADVSLRKTRTSGPVVPGARVVWDLVVTNAGPSLARGVTLADTVPAALGAVDARPDTDPATCTVNGRDVDCDLGDLAPGGSVVVTVAGTLDAGFTGELANTATVSSPTDPEPGNDTDTSTGAAQPRSDVGVLKTLTSDTPVPGSPVSWRLTVTNDGPSTATDVVLLDDVPTGVVDVTVTGPAGSGCTLESGTVRCALGDLAPGAAPVEVVLTGRLSPDLRGELANTATVSTASRDENPANDQDSTSAPTRPEADLSLDKAVSPARPVAGGPVRFVLTTTNAGPSTATGVALSDPVDPRITDLAARVLSPAGSGAACEVLDSLVTCDLPVVEVGAPVVVEVTGTLDPTAEGTLSNTATLVPGPESDLTPADLTDTATTAPLLGADLAVTKRATRREVVAGGTAGYTITVANAGPATASDVVLSDRLPDGLRATSAVLEPAAAGRCTLGATVRCRVPELLARQEVVIVLEAAVGTGARGRRVNTATVASPGTDPTPADTTDSAAITVVARAGTPGGPGGGDGSGDQGGPDTPAGPGDVPAPAPTGAPDTDAGGGVLPDTGAGAALLGLLVAGVLSVLGGLVLLRRSRGARRRD